MLELCEVSKVYQRKRIAVEAVSSVSMQIKDGDFAVITGQSGSGKSTLMSLIGCLDVPTRGSVVIDGIDISKLSPDELARIRNKKIGFIFQQFNLMPTLTALDNVALPAELAGKPYDEAVAVASKLLDQVGLADRASHYPNELSGGQMQRVAIARSLVNDPEIILADEPTGNLDSKSGEEVVKILCNLNKLGKTIILITHERRLVAKGNKHFVLVDGKIVKKGGK